MNPEILIPLTWLLLMYPAYRLISWGSIAYTKTVPYLWLNGGEEPSEEYLEQCRRGAEVPAVLWPLTLVAMFFMVLTYIWWEMRQRHLVKGMQRGRKRHGSGQVHGTGRRQ